MKITLLLSLCLLMTNSFAEKFIFLADKGFGFGDVSLETKGKNSVIVNTDNMGFSNKFQACVKLEKVLSFNNDNQEEALLSLHPSCGGSGIPQSHIILFKKDGKYIASKQFGTSWEPDYDFDKSAKGIIKIVENNSAKSSIKEYMFNGVTIKAIEHSVQLRSTTKKNGVYKKFTYASQFNDTKKSSISFNFDIDENNLVDKLVINKVVEFKAFSWEVILNKIGSIQPAKIETLCSELFFLKARTSGVRDIICDSEYLVFDSGFYSKKINNSVQNEQSAFKKNTCNQHPSKSEVLSENVLDDIDRIIDRGDLKSFTSLIDCGLNINARADNRAGSNLLSIAVRKKAYKFIKFLLAKGIDVDIRDGDYKTPLFIAVENKDKTSIELLITHDADIHAKNKFNDSVFEITSKYGIDLASYSSKKTMLKIEKPPQFKEFPVKKTYQGENHKLILDDFSKQFHTRLKAVIKVDKPTFAGKYLIARWGCGSGGCNTGAIIDASTGKAYSFPVSMSSVYPVKPESGGEEQELIYKLDSRLMIFAGNIEGKKSYTDSVLFYEFTDEEFKLLKVLPYGKSANSNEAGTKEKEEPKPAIQTKIEAPKSIEVAKQVPAITPPKNAEIIKIEKTELIEKSASGPISLTFLTSLFGLLAWRAS